METKIKSLYQSLTKDIKEKQALKAQKQLIKLINLIIEGIKDKKISPTVAVEYFEALYSSSFYNQLDNLSQILVNEGLLLGNRNDPQYLKSLKGTLESVKEGIVKQKRIKETQRIVLEVKDKLKKALGRLPTSEEVMDYMRKHHPDRVSHKHFDITDFAKFKIRKRVD